MPAQALDSFFPSPPSERLGRYRILTELGQGGMGAIHLAVAAGSFDADELGEFEKLVVIKELKPELAMSSEFVSMFLREVKLAARLNHGNIVQTIEAGKIDDRYFMSMEFLDGQPFTKLVAKASEKSRVPLRLRLQILCDALSGLHYAHELKDYDGTPLSVVHCDVSFGNVFITYEGQVKLVDFGVARVADTLSRGRGFQGKVRYAAPEQLASEPIDRRADIYSAGILLWEVLALRRYTAALKSDRAVIEARLAGTEPKIASILSHVDPELAAISDRALERDPEKRFATAEDFRLALSGYLSKLGPRIDTSEIARLMRTEFADERSRIHQLISVALKGPGDEVQSGPIVKSTLDDEVTTVADLSTLIESIGTSRVTERPGDPDKRRPRFFWGIGLAAGLVGAVGFGALAASRPGDVVAAAALVPSPLATGSDATKEALIPSAPPRPSERPGVLLEFEADDRIPQEGVSRRGEGTAAHEAKEAGPASSGRDSRVASSAVDASPSPSPASPGLPAVTPGSSSSVTTGSTATRKDRIPGARLGEDMAPRPKAERAGIDSENPFK